MQPDWPHQVLHTIMIRGRQERHVSTALAALEPKNCITLEMPLSTPCSPNLSACTEWAHVAAAAAPLPAAAPFQKKLGSQARRLLDLQVRSKSDAAPVLLPIGNRQKPLDPQNSLFTHFGFFRLSTCISSTLQSACISSTRTLRDIYIYISFMYIYICMIHLYMFLYILYLAFCI